MRGAIKCQPWVIPNVEHRWPCELQGKEGTLDSDPDTADHESQEVPEQFSNTSRPVALTRRCWPSLSLRRPKFCKRFTAPGFSSVLLAVARTYSVFYRAYFAWVVCTEVRNNACYPIVNLYSANLNLNNANWAISRIYLWLHISFLIAAICYGQYPVLNGGYSLWN